MTETAGRRRDEAYFAREDIAFNAWVDARRSRLGSETSDNPMLRQLLRSAFQSGVRFGESSSPSPAVMGEKG